VFAPPEGAEGPDVRAMFDAALARDTVAPQLRKRARRSVTSLGQWGWDTDTDTDVDLDYHVRRDALPQPGGMTELFALVSRLHAFGLDRGRPLWEMHLIEGLAGGRYAVYTKIHHAVADGVSAMKMLRACLSEDPDRRDMPAPWEPPAATAPRPPLGPSTGVSPLDLPGAVLRVARGAVGEVAGLVPALVGTLDRALREQGGSLSLSAPNTVFNVPIGGARRFAARSWPIERLRLVAKSADATINDVVLSMCSGALRAYLRGLDALPENPLIAAVPVSLRGEQDNTAGNAVGLLMCNLATHLADPARRLGAVRTCMLEGKHALRTMSAPQMLAMSALGAAPLALGMLLGDRSPLRPPFNVIISNVAGPTAPMYWNGAHLDALYPVSVPVDGQALNITCTSTGDQIAFGLTGCRASVPRLQPLLGHLDDELGALEHAVGL